MEMTAYRGLMFGQLLKQVTDLQSLAENGVEKLKPLGQTFDPNLHEALFEMPSADKKAGTVGAITKVTISSRLSFAKSYTDLLKFF